MRRLIIWLSVGIIFLTTSATVGGSWLGCELGIHPVRVPDKYLLSQFTLPEPQQVRFASQDGLQLAGWFFAGRSRATIVLVHGRRGSRAWMLPDAAYLHKAGYSVLLVDLRYRGESQGDHSTFGAMETKDVEAAITYLLARTDVDPERIGVQGTSLGGVTAILAAANMPAVKGVVAESPFKDLNSAIDYAFQHAKEGVGLPKFPFLTMSKQICQARLGVDFERINPASVIANISPRPILLIDTTLDDLIPRDSVDTLYHAARTPKYLWKVQAPHGKGWETNPREYERHVVKFWQQTLPIPEVERS
ncbi:MAG: alpha/beta fold hydrolase [Nitrospirales bacterium]|nr:alpha/beta fold hydrolase [Nitrospira sp.]MDR4500033.1 alpha/beta fold hydrolase [Nitrospirales bacterium]